MADWRKRVAGRPAFMRLGIALVRHPWYPVIFWLALLGLGLPLALHASSVTTPNATSLPDSYPSQVAAHEIARLFPNSSSSSSSLIVLYGPNITGPVGRDSLVALRSAILSNGSFEALGGATTYFSAYQQYLTGETELGLGVWQSASATSPTVFDAVNGTSELLWGPAAAYVGTWQALVAQNPTSPPSQQNYPAYVATYTALNGSPPAQANLTLFYSGLPGQNNGFNGTAACASDPATVVPCSDATLRSLVAGEFGSVVIASPPVPALPAAVAAYLGIENYTNATARTGAAAAFLGISSGLPPSWLRALAIEFPTFHATALEEQAWTGEVVATGTPSTYPLPVPARIGHSFVNPADNVTFLLLTFTQDSSSAAVAHDVALASAIVPTTLRLTDPAGTLGWLPSGDAALTLNSDSLLNQDLAITVPVTVTMLVAITILYFRAPGSPLLTLAPIGVALLLGLACLFLVGTFVERVHTSALTLLTVFVLGVGTDYSVFLLARYREELGRGRSPRAAVVLAVTWAGESIATSGISIVFATVALAFSGASLLSQWGLVLSAALAIAVLVSLTLVPALLLLVGPRIFWPYTGKRFRDQVAARGTREREERSYFRRVGRFSTRHAKAIVTAAVLLSLPVLYVAANVPLAYDYFSQLPSSQPAAKGLNVLAENFGPGYVFPLDVLVTFASPLVVGNSPNATEFTQVSALTSTFSSMPGVARTDSPVGPAGVPLTAWLALPTLPPAVQQELKGMLAGYVGTDGRTVWFTVQPDASGLSNSAVGLLNTVEANLSAYATSHPDVVGVAYAGAPSITRDVQGQLAQGSARLEAAVVIGLMAVLLFVLVSLLLPPLAVATIGLSIGWAWTTTYLVLSRWFGLSLFFYVPVILFIVLMGLGMDYNIFLLTRVREERLAGNSSEESVVRAISYTGGIITAAAAILGGAFFVLLVAQTTLLKAIGLAVGLSVLLDAMVVRSYLVPAILGLVGDRVWWAPRFLRRLRPSPTERAPATDRPK